jgi:hypothetical protein
MLALRIGLLSALVFACHPAESGRPGAPASATNADPSSTASASTAGSVPTASASTASTAPPSRAALHEAVRCDDAEWTVLAVRDLGHDVKGNGTIRIDPKHTNGRFVEVQFTAKNTGTKPSPMLLLARPRIVDDRGRAFDAIPMEGSYIPPGARSTALDVLAPGESREYRTVIDVSAADARTLSFQVTGFAKDATPKLIALGI